MKFIIKAIIPTEAGNRMVADPAFVQNFEKYINDTKAEGVYFYESGGNRSIAFVVDMQSTDQMASIAEPLFQMGANVEFHPAMALADLKKAVNNMPK